MFQELLLSLGKRSEGLILAWPEQLGGRPIELEADAETELSWLYTELSSTGAGPFRGPLFLLFLELELELELELGDMYSGNMDLFPE